MTDTHLSVDMSFTQHSATFKVDLYACATTANVALYCILAKHTEQSCKLTCFLTHFYSITVYKRLCMLYTPWGRSRTCQWDLGFGLSPRGVQKQCVSMLLQLQHRRPCVPLFYHCLCIHSIQTILTVIIASCINPSLLLPSAADLTVNAARCLQVCMQGTLQVC